MIQKLRNKYRQTTLSFLNALLSMFTKVFCCFGNFCTESVIHFIQDHSKLSVSLPYHVPLLHFISLYTHFNHDKHHLSPMLCHKWQQLNNKNWQNRETYVFLFCQFLLFNCSENRETDIQYKLQCITNLKTKCN